MIIDFNRYNGGGGSGSGVTPQDVQRQIDRALTPYWESGETKSYVDGAVSGISLDGYYTSAQTEEAIAQAVSGLATEQYVQDALSGVNLDNYYTSAQTEQAITSKNYVTSGEVETQITDKNYITSQALTSYTPTSGFSTINGSAITAGGNIEIQGGSADLSGYWTSAQTEEKIASAVTPVAEHLAEVEQVTASAYTELHDDILELSARTAPDLSAYYTSAQTEEAITSKNYVVSGQVKSQVEAYNYVTSAETEAQILSKNYTTSAETKAYVDSAVTGVQDQIDTMDEVIAEALVDLNGRVDAISAATPDLSPYWTSAQTENALSSALVPYYTSAQTNTAISAATQNMVVSSDVRQIVKLTQAAYDQLATKDPYTFYIIVNSNSN